MKAEASGTDIIERAALESCWFERDALIRQKNFYSALGSFLPAKLQLVAAHLDGGAGAATIGGTHDVGERFVDGADNGPSLGVVKVQDFGSALNGGTNEAQRFRIA